MVNILVIFFSSLILAIMAVGFSPSCFNLVGPKVAASVVLVCLLGFYLCLVLFLIYLGRKLAGFTFKKVLAVKSFLEARTSRASMCVVVVGGILIVWGTVGLGYFEFVLMKVGGYLFWACWLLAVLPADTMMVVVWVVMEFFKGWGGR